jgi:hypothetical protein
MSRIKGICADAAALGVERTHLYRVLKGQRESASLTRRYKALLAARGESFEPANPTSA